MSLGWFCHKKMTVNDVTADNLCSDHAFSIGFAPDKKMLDSAIKWLLDYFGVQFDPTRQAPSSCDEEPLQLQDD
jgi:hypothetical protein